MSTTAQLVAKIRENPSLADLADDFELFFGKMLSPEGELTKSIAATLGVTGRTSSGRPQAIVGPAGLTAGRLSVSPTNPIVTSSATSSIAYFHNFKGNQISVWDGTKHLAARWSAPIPFVAPSTAKTLADAFVYVSNGELRGEISEWSSETARKNDVAMHYGYLAKKGDPTRRYVGTYGTDSGTVIADTPSKKYIWNYNNRLPSLMKFNEAAANWTLSFGTSTFAAANSDTLNRMTIVNGYQEVPFQVSLRCDGQTVAGIPAGWELGIGINRTDGSDSDSLTPVSSADEMLAFESFLYHYPAVGLTRYQWVEAPDNVESVEIYRALGLVASHYY